MLSRSQDIHSASATRLRTEAAPARKALSQLSLGQACLALAIITLICYWPVTTYDFVNVDDQDYVTRNPHVQAGLTLSAIGWALRTGYFCSWHPLTWISHIIDCQLYGLNAGGHHLTSLSFHIADTLLLFLLLARCNRPVWRSAFVAALFACHPLHVESVAWISERKDVLSTFFLLLTLWFYSRYAACRSQPDSNGTKPMNLGTNGSWAGAPWFSYAMSLLLFACGLMSKSMLVTLPAVLVLWDYWPLRRFGPTVAGDQRASLGRLILEKLPFLAMAFASSVVTFLVQKAGGAVSELGATSLQQRLANVPVAYVRYLQKTVWPFDLAMFYPYPSHWPVGVVVASLSLLLVITCLVVFWRRSQPYLLVGWFWFLGTLFPVIGLIQVGGQSMADRYMYIPSIGLFIAVTWAGWTFAGTLRNSLQTSALVSIGAIAACLALTSIQVRYWRDGITLCRHTVDVTKDNYFAYCYLGEALSGSGDAAGALPCYAKAVELAPQNLAGHFYLGSLLVEAGRIDEAIKHLELAVAISPGFVQAQNNLGIALMNAGKQDQAVQHFLQAARLEPEDPDARFNLGRALQEQHKPADAAVQFQSAVRLRPNDPKIRYRLAGALSQLGETREAVFQYQEALRLAPDSPTTLNELAAMFVSHPNPELGSSRKALDLAVRACELTDYQDPSMLTTLAAAYTEAGQCQDATQAAQRARDLALTSNQPEIVERAGVLQAEADSTP